jgi:two-component system chemotaxis response regulator CheB
VIMVSAVTEKDAEVTFKALSIGAFDYVPKQMCQASLEIAHIRSDLIAKIRAAAHAHRPLAHGSPARKPPQASRLAPRSAGINPAIVAIGTSTGGPRALEQILPRFPPDFPLPILIVQHMPAGFTATFAARLNTLSAINVREATDQEVIHCSTAYICPAGVHMRVRRGGSDSRTVISLETEPATAAHIPSADILMKSVATFYGNRALGVIMTGMGTDGAEGMTAIYREGGMTIGQDEAT